jgi:hypothetical protein
MLRNLIFLIPIIFYYFFESLLLAIFINLPWMFIFQPKFNFHISYLDWVFIIWVCKLILFDVFKMIASINNINNINNQDNDNTYNPN